MNEQPRGERQHMSEPRYLKIENYHPWWESWTLELQTTIADGKSVWSDGHILMWGDPPTQHEEWSTGFTLKPENVERVLQGSDRETLRLLTPEIVHILNEDTHVVYFQERLVMNARFFNLLSDKFPGCEFWGDEQCSQLKQARPIICKHQGSIVALIMGMRSDEEEIDRALQSANAASPQSTNNPEESANT